MNRKRIGQLLIGGVFTLCAAAAAALYNLVSREEARQEAADAETPFNMQGTPVAAGKENSDETL
jgi:hypothetical protein